MKKFITLHPLLFTSFISIILVIVLCLLFVSGIIPYSKVNFYICVTIMIVIVVVLDIFTKDYSENNLSKYHKKKEEPKYSIKAEYYYEEACEVYCKQKNKNYDNLTSKDEEKIWEYARNFISYLVQWLIENDLFLYNEEDEETKELVKKCKERKIEPGKIVQEVCDERLIEDDLVPEIRDF